MSKKIKIIIVSILLFVICEIHISKVIASIDNSFFYTNKQELAAGEMLEMTLDISKTKYDELEFKLCSNLDINNIVTNEDIVLENYNNEISINIDKSKINLEKITLYYQVPENIQVGTMIELVAQIVVNSNKLIFVDNYSIEYTEIDDLTNNNIETTETESNVVEEKIINVEVIEKKPVDNKENKNIEKENTEENLNNSLFTNTNKSIKDNKVESVNNSVNSISSVNFSSISTKTEIAVYNGSNNNYLSSIEIEGEDLNTTFNKENMTYFVKTTEKTSLNVKVTAEDNTAKIYVTGNENLKIGNNKILISVTAENGDVRYYRVFVTNSVLERE